MKCVVVLVYEDIDPGDLPNQIAILKDDFQIDPDYIGVATGSRAELVEDLVVDEKDWRPKDA